MSGIYYYHLRKREWQWHINYMGEQVDSGTCKHKGEMEKVLEKNGFVSWEKY